MANTLHITDEQPVAGPSSAEDYTERYRGTAAPICIDNGSSTLRAGWAGEQGPRFAVENVAARYKDRKSGRHVMLAGGQVYADGTSKLNIKYPYEGDVVCNFDSMEVMLDYTFVKLGIADCPSIEHPIAMTETLCNPVYSHSLMNELIFESYGVPAVGYASDALSALYGAGIKDSLLISSSASGTTVMPVLDGNGLLNHTKRLAWGGLAAADYLVKLLQLKYPAFQVKLTLNQASNVVKECCYLSPDFPADMQTLSNPDKVADVDRVLQFPYQTTAVVERSQEELQQQTDRRREQMRRMQEQAAKQRAEKLAQKEQDMAIFQDLVTLRETDDPVDWQRRLEAQGFGTFSELQDAMKKTERSLKRARNKEMGIDEDENKEPPSFPLVDVPDHLLGEEELKDKRRQRLMKAGYDARIKAKAEKEVERKRREQELQADAEFRARDPEGWLAQLRQQHEDILARIRDRDAFKTQLGDRKSLAAQNRMKSIANLASDAPARSKRKKTAEDTFGANDADWAVYREIGNDDESEDEEDDEAQLLAVEAQLIEHDPGFTEDDTAARMAFKKTQLLNAFIRGMRPSDPLSSCDLSDPAQAAQMHVNIERIRVPEALHQPQIAGIDQAGLIEVIGHVLRHFSLAEQERMLANVYVVGGHSLTPNFDLRLDAGLKSILPADSAYAIRRPPIENFLEAPWRGLSAWSSSSSFQKACISQQDYYEKGGEYLKEHPMVAQWSR